MTYSAVRDRFDVLQQRLAPMWPAMTVRGSGEARTLIVLSSVSMDVPSTLHSLLPAYEERYLVFVLGLARSPATKVIFLASQPTHPAVLDYYLGLMGDENQDELRRRLVPLYVGDWSNRPLTAKILERPRFVERLRSHVPDRSRAVILPFVTTDLEARLALELGIPMYGPNPRLAGLGSKSGSRAVFAAAGVPHPEGVCGVRTASDVIDALEPMVARGVGAAMVKLDDAVSGFGNAVVRLAGASSRSEIEERVRDLNPEREELDVESFLEMLEAEGGIVEERIEGQDFRSPSVQLRASPLGGAELLSTHDQILSGPNGQTYQGCRFPADAGYAGMISEYGQRIGDELSAAGVIGRFGVDFVVRRSRAGWEAFAIEINLRNGGTTHPTLTLLALTDGEYDESTATLTSRGRKKHYVASDHVAVSGLETLTPEDLPEILDATGLGWDRRRLTGAVFHMLSGVPIAGQVGLTAIGDSAAEAEGIMHRVESALRAAAAVNRTALLH